MTNKQIRNAIYYSLLLWIVILVTTSVAYAALYNIVGTKEYVNGVPSSLTVKERAKLTTVTAQSQTEAACVQPCVLLNKTAAKAKIKAIIASEVCVPPQTGTWPNCVTPPPPTCPSGTTGTPPNCTPIVVVPPVTDLMPFVDTSKNIVPVVGFDSLRIKTTGKMPYNGDIAIRVFCGVSHMNNDDPLVFPNQQNATHHHTYFGNTSVDYKSDLNNLANVGNSTCWGGTMNRSAYWHPTMIDATGKPMISDSGDGNGQGVLFYYKAGYDGVRPEDIKPVPNGLRILTGNPKAKTNAEMQNVNWHCHVPSTGNGHSWNSKSIANCGVGEYLVMAMDFPRCWDGKNLDSPSHKDHMSRAIQGVGCPATHPVPLPQITFNMRFKVTKPNEALTWRLSSDNYAYNGTNAGYSAHADYTAAWNQEFMGLLVKNCLNAKRDCGGDVIGDGRVFF